MCVCGGGGGGGRLILIRMVMNIILKKNISYFLCKRLRTRFQVRPSEYFLFV